MKTLLLLRHAKSSWDDATLSDHDRPLKSRGIKAARRMGRLIREQNLCPERILCSTAVRARETLRLALEESGTDPVTDFTERLFHCSPSEFALILRDVDSAVSTVLLIGHNPGLEDFLQQLTGQSEQMPTAALARLELDVSDWSRIDDATPGKLIGIWRPRELA